MKMNSRHIFSCAIVVALTMMAGCQSKLVNTVRDALPDSKTLLNVAETSAAITNLRQSYILARSAVRENRAIFSDSEWQILERGNESIIDLDAKIQALKRQRPGATMLVTSTELLELIIPVRDAIKDMTIVLDNHLPELPKATQFAYLDASRNFAKIDGQLDRILSTKDRRVKAQMLIDFLKVAARLVGVAQIVLEKTE